MTTLFSDPESIAEGNFVGPKLAPFNPTNLDAIHVALDLLHLTSNDVVYDLGCGDGRFLIEVQFLDVTNIRV